MHHGSHSHSLIENIEAIEILDSRGFPTVEVTITTISGIKGTAAVPSGASTGKNEALELRDHDSSRYFGKGVRKAIGHIHGEIKDLLLGRSVINQSEIDSLLIALDGTLNKARLGANAILAVSLAVAKCAANVLNIPFYRYIGGCFSPTLPCPMINIVNGGAHADNLLDFQEIMIRPWAASSFSEALQWSVEIFGYLKKILKEKGLSTGVGDEGGFAPQIDSAESALLLVTEAIIAAGFEPGSQISLALDCAASEFYDEATGLYYEKKKQKAGYQATARNSLQQIEYLAQLVDTFPIDSIEDGLSEEDWNGWSILTQTLGQQIQIVGDDIFVTNPNFLARAIEEQVGNSILIKLNQIGTLTETIETVEMAKLNGYTTIISHRSGETEDSTIADIAVALGAGQIKTGSVCRSDRTAKYNRLLKIEKELGQRATYYDSCSNGIATRSNALFKQQAAMFQAGGLGRGCCSPSGGCGCN